MIPDRAAGSESPESVKKLIFCSGRVYYDLTKARAERKLESNIAIARIEQVSALWFLFLASSSLKLLNPHRFHPSHMTWWRKSATSIRTLSCAGRKRNTKIKAHGITSCPALTPVSTRVVTSGKTVMKRLTQSGGPLIFFLIPKKVYSWFFWQFFLVTRCGLNYPFYFHISPILREIW